MDASDVMPPPDLIEAIRKDIGAYEARRRHAHTAVTWRVPVIMTAFAAVVLLCVVLRWSVISSWEWGLVEFALIFAAAFGGSKLYAFARQPATGTQQEFRNHLLPVIFGFVEEVRYAHGWRPSWLDRLPKAVTGDFNIETFDDFISGRHDGFRFELSELVLQMKAGKSTTTVFKGIVLGFELEEPFPGRLVAARRGSSFLRGLRDFFDRSGLATISSGAAELEAIYEFRTDNERAARPILRDALADSLLWLNRRWPEGPVRIALAERHGFVLLPADGRNFFELPDIAETIDYRAHIEPMIRQFAMMLATGKRVREAVAGAARPQP